MTLFTISISRLCCRCYGDYIEFCTCPIRNCSMSWYEANYVVENTWSFKPITFEESVMFMIRMDSGSTTNSLYIQWAIKDWTNFMLVRPETRAEATRYGPLLRVSRPRVHCGQLEAARTLKSDWSTKYPQPQDFAQNPEWNPLDLFKGRCPGLLSVRCMLT